MPRPHTSKEPATVGALRPLPHSAPPEQDYITLEVFGRVNNAYRWAGETDVFEALESVQKRYKIDDKRIVLRGFSMGGAGTWHLGLHHPDRWAAIEAGAGFSDTKKYAKVTGLTPWQEATLHIYDAEDYALNAFNVPLVAYAGEDDPAIRSTINMREALEREGFKFTPSGLNWLTTDLHAIFLIGPKTPHRWHPDSKKESDKFINEAVANTALLPEHVRLVTYTTRYNRCSGVVIEAVEQHYNRAEVDAQLTDAGKTLRVKTMNVARLVLPKVVDGLTVTIDGQTSHYHVAEASSNGFQTTGRIRSGLFQFMDGGRWPTVLEKLSGTWRQLTGQEHPEATRKHHGVQGPIDDAFMESFICVRPTGAPSHALVNDYAKAVLDLFTKEFPKWMRGDVQIKNDTAVTNADIEVRNLILFGDPSSNGFISRIADKLPIRWTKETISVGGKSFSAADHMLVMIYPNPLNPNQYIVLNSGHTFHEKDFRSTNAMLFPRLGDYAVIKLTKNAKGEIEESVETAGIFGEKWELK